MMMKFLAASVVLLSSFEVIAQNAPPAYPNRPMHRGAMQPCLREAGIDRSAIEQLQAAQRDMHEQIRQVCSSTSLSPGEKQKQVEEIRDKAHEKIEILITPDQQKKLIACRQQHGEGTPGILSGTGGGGCGEHPSGGTRSSGPGAGNTHPPATQSSPQY